MIPANINAHPVMAKNQNQPPETRITTINSINKPNVKIQSVRRLVQVLVRKGSFIFPIRNSAFDQLSVL
jgi:hypothetical protein